MGCARDGANSPACGCKDSMSSPRDASSAQFAFLTLSSSQHAMLTTRFEETCRYTPNLKLDGGNCLISLFSGARDENRFFRVSTPIFPGRFLKGRPYQAAITEYLTRPRSFIGDEDLRRQLANDGIQFHSGYVPIRTGFRKFFLDRTTSRRLPAYCAYNCLSADADTSRPFDVFEHYLEAEFSEDYSRSLLGSIVESADPQESSGTTDPIGDLEAYLFSQGQNVPELSIVLWLYHDDMAALVTEISTIPGFNYDLLEDESPEFSPVWEVFAKGERIGIPNLRENKALKLGQNVELLQQLAGAGQRSALLDPVIIRGRTRGVLGFFAHNYGAHLQVYSTYLSLIRQRIVGQLSEADRLSDLLLLNTKIKSLTPLMAIGQEVTERMHDIRDNMTILSNYFSMVQNEKRYPDREKLKAVGASGLLVLDKIRTTLSRQLQAFRNAREQRRRTELKSYISECLESTRISAGFGNVSVNYLEPDVPIYASVQRFYFARALFNLMMNAVFFSRQRIDVREPFVQIELTRTSSHAIITFTDSGPGISQRPLERVFDVGETTKAEGFGIGLWFAFNIVQEHGGALKVENGPRYGAKFEITLPLHREP